MSEFHKQVLMDHIQDYRDVYATPRRLQEMWAEILSAIDALIAAVRAEALVECELKAGKAGNADV